MKTDRRLKRLKSLLKRLQGGQDVARRDLENVLTEEQFRELGERWDAQKSLRTVDKPPEIKKYEALLRKAQLADAKTERYSSIIGLKRKNHISNRLAAAADNCFEDACEYLLEIQSEYGDWFDLQIGSERYDHYFELPRVVTSRSGQNESKGYGEHKTIRELKIGVLEEAIDDIERPDKANEANQAFEEAVKQIRSMKEKRTKDRFKKLKV